MSKCLICQCELGEVPMCFGAGSPASLIVPEGEYESRVVENRDQCIVDEKHYFVRGHIQIPVLDAGDVFIWSVWVSLSRDSFLELSRNWDREGRENSDPYFGWLMTNLPCYPETLHLKTIVRTQPVGFVPLVTIQECDHPLFREQNQGITMHRVHEIVHETMRHART